ncbi:redox-regulated ATPase YchF [Candidatus Saccharibacteria bacterium]|nr:redox-regulated ATPase YchF [Candidatus Saccharibacteria bacterium]
MALSIGIVGLPNVGKSTLFNILTRAGVLAANYPFATIEPNVGIVEVPDHRLAELVKISDSKKLIPATIKFVDIAGLVSGASKGEGLGNKFLSHIREVDAIIQVVRDFNDPEVIHHEGSPDPARDIEIIQTELALADQAVIQTRLNSIAKEIKKDKDLELTQKLLLELQETLDKMDYQIFNQFKQGLTGLSGNSGLKALGEINQLGLLSLKPIIYLVNLDEDGLVDQSKQVRLQDVLPDSAESLMISVKLEDELSELEQNEALELLQEYGQKESGIDQLIGASYRLLGLQSYFTTGPEETRAWTIRYGSTAPIAAGVIHTDFQSKFIRAEVVAYQDFVENLGWVEARKKGLVRMEGKEYIVQDGDIMVFHHS